MTHGREPRRPLEEVGEEPDPRFTMANERTFLAWNRTALALIGGGLAAAQLLPFDPTWLRLVVALPIIVLGTALGVLSYRRWDASERALRLGRPLGYSRMVRLLAGGVALTGALAAVVAVVDAVTG
jgi:putative membrane protein